MKYFAIIIILIGNMLLLYPKELDFGADVVWKEYFMLNCFYGRFFAYTLLILLFFIVRKCFKTPIMPILLGESVFVILLSLLCWTGSPVHLISFVFYHTFISGGYESEFIILFDVILSILLSVLVVRNVKV